MPAGAPPPSSCPDRGRRRARPHGMRHCLAQRESTSSTRVFAVPPTRRRLEKEGHVRTKSFAAAAVAAAVAAALTLVGEPAAAGSSGPAAGRADAGTRYVVLAADGASHAA